MFRRLFTLAPQIRYQIALNPLVPSAELVLLATLLRMHPRVRQLQLGSASNSLSVEKVELSEGNEHTVRMLNIGPGGSMVFDPPVIKVSVGDTIHFKATDLSHNSASIQDMIPAGASDWAGALNEDVSVKLESEGVYVYQCDPHLVMAMVGVIQVGAATNLEEIKQAARTMKSTFAMNAERLETYISRL